MTFIWQNYQIGINESGDLSSYPKGMFDIEPKQIAQIVRLKRGEVVHESLTNFVK